MRPNIGLLLFLLLAHAYTATFHHDFSQTMFKVSLTSSETSKTILKILDCSCQLVVFPVYNSTYNISITAIKDNYSHIQIYVQSINYCRTVELDSHRQASLQILHLNYKDSDQITESIFARPYSGQNNQNCQGIQDDGEERAVYLVDVNEKDQYQYIIHLPFNAIWMTQLLAFLVLFLLCQNTKYRRFTPIRFGFIFAIFYALFLFATVYIQTYIQDNLQITFWIVMIFAIVCMTIYFIDLTSIFLDKTSAIISLSVVMSLIMGLIDTVVLPDAWFVNDLIAITVAGALIKFVVIKKLKAAVLPLTFLWLFFLLRQFAVLFHIQNFQQALQIKVVPLFMQLPAIFSDDENGYVCSAFGTSKIITMGLIVNYAVRVDLFLSSKFYTILSSLIALICLTLELGVSLLSDELPVMEYTSVIIFIPATFVVMLLFASKRGEWAQIWHGSFHDIAVDRKSVKKEESILDEQEISRNLDLLRMNPSLLSDN